MDRPRQRKPTPTRGTSHMERNNGNQYVFARAIGTIGFATIVISAWAPSLGRGIYDAATLIPRTVFHLLTFEDESMPAPTLRQDSVPLLGALMLTLIGIVVLNKLSKTQTARMIGNACSAFGSRISNQANKFGDDAVKTFSRIKF